MKVPNVHLWLPCRLLSLHCSFMDCHCFNRLTLTHETLKLPSYRNQSINLQRANQLTGFYVVVTLAFNELTMSKVVINSG